MCRAGGDIRSWLMNASTLSHFLTSNSVTENIRWHLREKTRIKRLKQGEGIFIHFINDDIWLGQAFHKYSSLTAGLLLLYSTLQPDFIPKSDTRKQFSWHLYHVLIDFHISNCSPFSVL